MARLQQLLAWLSVLVCVTLARRASAEDAAGAGKGGRAAVTCSSDLLPEALFLCGNIVHYPTPSGYFATGDEGMVRDAMLEDYFLHLYDEFKARMGPVSQYCTGSLKRQLCLARFPLCEASTAPGSEPAHLQYCFAKVFPGETVTVCAPRADKMQIVCLNAPWGRTCVRANDCVFLGGQTDFDTDHCNETFVRTERCFFERAQSNRTSETARYFSAAPGDGSALLANSTLLHKWHSEWEEHVDAPPADEGSRPSASHPATADPLVARIVAGLLVAGMLAFMAVKLWGVVAPPLRGMLYGRAGFQPVGAGQAELVGDDADA